MPETSPPVRLGFGTPALMGAGSRREQFALLEAALAAGITHWDSSPYYGYGAVEPLLGEFLAAHGAAGTVTTKFGIRPPPPVARSRWVMRAARGLAALSPRLKRLLARGASKMVTRGAFDAPEAEKSLRDSLRNLRRDRVDFFLLHEPELADTRRPGLEEFLHRAVGEGQVGQFGVGGTWGRVAEVIAAAPAFASVAQFENPPEEDRVPKATGGRTVITFGGVGPAVRRVREWLAREPGAAAGWQQACGLDPRDESTLGAALLALAAARNPGGIVLSATRDPRRLERNVRAVQSGEFRPEQLAALAALLAGVPAG